LAIIITSESAFKKGVILAGNPVLCLFSKAEEFTLWDEVLLSLKTTMAKQKPGIEFDEVVVAGWAAPDIIDRECKGLIPPLVRLYHLGRESATAPLGKRGINKRAALLIGAPFGASLDASWNQLGVDPGHFI
jgi:hypothetical protein